jgi:hypothetical protein
MTKVVGETDQTKFGENVGSCDCDNARNMIVIIHTKTVVIVSMFWQYYEIWQKNG